MEGEIQMDNSYFDSLAVVLPEDIEKLKWRGSLTGLYVGLTAGWKRIFPRL